MKVTGKKQKSPVLAFLRCHIYDFFPFSLFSLLFFPPCPFVPPLTRSSDAAHQGKDTGKRVAEGRRRGFVFPRSIRSTGVRECVCRLRRRLRARRGRHESFVREADRPCLEVVMFQGQGQPLSLEGLQVPRVEGHV